MTRSEHRDGVGATMTDGDDGTPDRSAAPDAHNPARDPTTPTVPAEAPEAWQRDEQVMASLVAPTSVATPTVGWHGLRQKTRSGAVALVVLGKPRSDRVGGVAIKVDRDDGAEQLQVHAPRLP